MSPGGTEKPRREEAIMTSKGSGTRRTKEKGDQRGQANDMGWFSAMMRGRSAHTRAALSPMMILVALSQYTPVLCGTPRTNVISKMSGGRTYATPYGERFLHLAQVKGKSRKHHSASSTYYPILSTHQRITCIVAHKATSDIWPTDDTEWANIPYPYSTISADHTEIVRSSAAGGRG